MSKKNRAFADPTRPAVLSGGSWLDSNRDMSIITISLEIAEIMC
jgi:hypothetical protein